MSPGLIPIADPEVTTSVRTVWISDLHLGTPGCQAGPLLDFLRQYECRTLYLVCLLYTSPSPRDRTRSRMPSSA